MLISVLYPGKTILTSLIVDHLTDEMREFKTSFFYCRESDETRGETRFLAICKSLLRQLIGHNRDLLPTLYEKRMHGQEVLSDEGTAKTLVELFCDTSMKQFIVIDGLDELSDIQRKNVVQCLDSIIDKTDGYSPGRIRVLLISTDLADMRRLVQSTDRVDVYELHPDNTLKDIKRYVTKQASRLRNEFKLSNEDLERARRLTCENANGSPCQVILP